MSEMPFKPITGILCPLCRTHPLEKGSPCCIPCQNRARNQRLDAVTERCAIEVFAQLIGVEITDDSITVETAASAAWTAADAFRAEMIKRLEAKR